MPLQIRPSLTEIRQTQNQAAGVHCPVLSLTTKHLNASVIYPQNQPSSRPSKSDKMNTTDLLMLLAFAFQFLLGLTSASPISSLSDVARSLSPNSWAPLTPVATRDDDHLCSASTDVVYEYGIQTNPEGLISDCQALSEKFKNITDEQGNITQSCGFPPPPSKRAARGFNLLGSQGNCSLWLDCLGNDSRNEVT